jgi:hypothetical protein
MFRYKVGIMPVVGVSALVGLVITLAKPLL